MDLQIRNNKKKYISNKELKAASLVFLNSLMPKTKKKIKLSIHFSPLDIKGYIEWVDRPVKPSQFKIVLNENFKKKQTLMTLAHEFVHLKQYATGELSDQPFKKHIKWKRKNFIEDESNYYDLPWEIEAYGREISLYVKYFKSVNVDLFR